jgi:hypothetical protein
VYEELLSFIFSLLSAEACKILGVGGANEDGEGYIGIVFEVGSEGSRAGEHDSSSGIGRDSK